jgi:hypothetical protein
MKDQAEDAAKVIAKWLIDKLQELKRNDNDFEARSEELRGH